MKVSVGPPVGLSGPFEQLLEPSPVGTDSLQHHAVGFGEASVPPLPDVDIGIIDVLLPIGVSVLCSLIVLAIGSVLILALGPGTARSTADATIETPGPPFAVGFVLLFTPLTAGAVLLVVGNALPDPLVLGAAIASALPFLLGLVWLAVGAAFGVVIVGRGIGRRYGDLSAWRSMLLGTVVVAVLLVVPVLGYVVAVAVSTLGGGSIALTLYTRQDRRIALVDGLVDTSTAGEDTGQDASLASPLATDPEDDTDTPMGPPSSRSAAQPQGSASDSPVENPDASQRRSDSPSGESDSSSRRSEPVGPVEKPSTPDDHTER